MGINKIDIEKVATAIEADSGELSPDLRQVFAEAKAGLGRVTKPEQILVRRAVTSQIKSPVPASAVGSPLDNYSSLAPDYDDLRT